MNRTRNLEGRNLLLYPIELMANKIWWTQTDLNCQRLACKASTLPFELWAHMVAGKGFEPLCVAYETTEFTTYSSIPQ